MSKNTVHLTSAQLHQWMDSGLLLSSIVDGAQQRFTRSAPVYMWDLTAFNRIIESYNRSQSVSQFFQQEITSMRGLLRTHRTTRNNRSNDKEKK